MYNPLKGYVKMFRFSKRAFILSAVAGTAFTLAGCKTTTEGNTTSVVLDTSKIKNYASAGVNAALMMIGITDTVPGLTRFSDDLRKGISRIQIALSTFDQIVGDNVTFSYDSTSYKTIVDSLLNGISDVLSIIETISKSNIFNTEISSTISKTVLSINTALSTIVNIYRVMIGLSINVASDGTAGMTEDEALSTLNVN